MTTAAFTVSSGRRVPAQRSSTIKPRRLRDDGTVGLVAPASATLKTIDLEIARELLEELGLRVIVGAHL